MTIPYRIYLSFLFVLFLTADAFAQMPVARDNIKQTQEEWLQSLPEKVRDSIVYKDWLASMSAIEKKESEAAQAVIDHALSDPNTTHLELSNYPNTELDPRITSLKNLQSISIFRAKKLNLTKLFDLLARLPKLHSLSLTDGSYSVLPGNIGSLTTLDSFNFKNSNIMTLPETFTKLKSLRFLGLEHNAYLYDEDVYDRLKQMNVTTLDLSACGLMEINAKIGEVKSLTRLDLSLNDVKELPASFVSLTSLDWLSLSQNTSLNGESVAATLSHLSHLNSLYLDQCYLSSLPVSIVTITSLKVLSARENVLASLPPTFNALTNLEELYLGSSTNAFRINVIPALPIGFGNLKKLRILDLSGNHLSDLGADFAQLTSLQWLDLSRNQLTAFPAQLASLAGLKFINLNRNRISIVPDGLGKLAALDSLFLDGDFFNKADKKIQSLPLGICSLKNLKKLTLKDNIIERLPDCIGDLSSLIWLDLRGNVVTQLPASVVKLAKLQTLDLKTNDLQSLPAGFEELHSLTDLNIAMNINADFTSIIPVLTKIKSLRLLDIGYNNLSRTQAQPLIDALSGCKILNIDYYNKAPLPTNTVPRGSMNDEAPKRNKK